MNYYRRFLGDYAADTKHLSLVEHGAYSLLLDTIYSTEKPLPEKHQELFRICSAKSAGEKASVLSVLRQFFVKRGNGYINRRAAKEISIAKSRISAAKANGRRGGRPKTQRKPSGLAESKQTNNPTPNPEKSSPTPTPVPTKRQSQNLYVPPQSILQGLGVSLSLWVQFKKMRERIHRPLIEGADELIIRDLLQFQDKGESPGEVIEQAVKTSSYTLYAVRKVNGNGNGHESYQEKRDRDGSQAITDILGVSSGLARSVQSSLRQGHAPPIRGRLPPGT